MSILKAPWLVTAQRLQEAAESLSSNELRSKLSDAVSKAHTGSQSGYYQDHTGDEDSGDCIYQCYGGGESNTMKAPYSKGTDASDSDYSLDTSKAVKVVPRMTYEEQPDEAGHYAAMEAAKLYTVGAVPLCERFVSKKERAAAGSGDFAGKGKSFPILKKEDVAAAAASIGRAGSDNNSTNTIKANIIKIAKAKGWASELPKAWQDDADASEAARNAATGDLTIKESCAFSIDMELRETFAAGKKIKIIAPGAGSSAYYTEAALKQAVADKIFHAGLPMRIDHPTKAEESARPEGSVKDWGAVLGSDGVYLESYMSGGKDQGPGIYSEIKPFSDHAQTISEKGQYAGVSIVANGKALVEAGRPVMRQGVPVLEKFTRAEGCDMVTRAGAGGLFLQESARVAQEESGMTADEKRLFESLVGDKLRGDAIKEGAVAFNGVSLNEAQREYIMDTVLSRPLPKTAEGLLDAAKFRESVTAEMQRFGGAIGAGPRVTGMGAAPAVVLTEAQRAEQKASADAEQLMFKESAIALLGTDDPKVIDRYMKGRAN